jgi:hypothetical protein
MRMHHNMAMKMTVAFGGAQVSANALIVSG